MITPAPLRKLFAVGTGVGIEIASDHLAVTAVRVRPNGVRLLGAFVVEDFRTRPAAKWGADLLSHLKKLGVQYVAATVMLPRGEVIVRSLHFPGVSNKDLPAALGYQIGSLHPYGEDEAVHDFARLGSSPHVLVGIARREVVERYSTLFTEAGIRVGAFTFSAASVYSAARLLGTPPADGFLAIIEHDGGQLEAYGESTSRPVFSAAFDLPLERVRSLAVAELRLPAEQEPVAVRDVLPAPRSVPEDAEPRALSYSAALAGACPRLALRANLLPPEERHSSSRAMYVPTAVLATILLCLAITLGVQAAYEDRRYLAALNAEISQLEPRIRQAATYDRRVEELRSRTRLLDDFRKRSGADMNVLKEATRLLPPPTWLNSIEISRTSVTFAGEADQAANLLKVLDESPLFENSDFALGITRVGNMEAFRIRSTRQGQGQGR